MAQATGALSYFSYVREVTPGVTPTTPELLAIPYQSTTVNLSRGLISDSSLNPDRMKRYSRQGNKSAGGNVSTSYAPNTFDAFVSGAFRSEWVEDVLKIGQKPISFTLELGSADINQYRTFRGMEVASFTLNVPSGNEMVTGEFEFLGVDGSLSTTSLDANGVDPALAGVPFVHLDATFEEDGEPIGYLTGVQVTIENALTQNYAAGSASARSITAGMVNVTGQLTAYFENAVLYNKWVNEENTNLEFTLISGDYSQKWTLPNVSFTANTIPVSGDGPIIQTITFEALYDAVADNVITVTRG